MGSLTFKRKKKVKLVSIAAVPPTDITSMRLFALDSKGRIWYRLRDDDGIGGWDGWEHLCDAPEEPHAESER